MRLARCSAATVDAVLHAAQLNWTLVSVGQCREYSRASTSSAVRLASIYSTVRLALLDSS